MFRTTVFCCFLISILSGCREPYNPPASSTPNSYLVVEGVINSGSDSTIITLSKTVSLTSKTTVNPVTGATVMVQNNQDGTTWPLVGDGHGNYAAAGLNLPASAQYRLSIMTADGSYLSDFVPVINTPPIDSVGYTLQNGAVQLYVNTHDPSNNVKFYRWALQETWKFHSEYYSAFVLDSAKQTIVSRTPAQLVYYCFGNDVSPAILIASTQHLACDQIYHNPLTSIPLSSEKLELEYSVLVKQYALTGDAYLFYQNLKKNTEQLGGIFDGLPSEVSGNIHRTGNSAVPVIGFVSVTNVQSKRIFIQNSGLPYVAPVYPYTCEQDTAKGNAVLGILIDPPVDFIPTQQVVGGYLYSSAVCVDCTVRGTAKTPSFWK